MEYNLQFSHKLRVQMIQLIIKYQCSYDNFYLPRMNTRNMICDQILMNNDIIQLYVNALLKKDY